jgi:ribosomal protein S18 acetylase RimI-like enzyme
VVGVEIERGLLWTRELSSSLDPPEIEGARFGEVEAGQADEPAAVMDGVGPEEVVARLTTGDRAFAWWLDGRIVCYCWTSTGSACIGELDTRLVLPPGEAYLWNCATLPAYRGRGLYTRLLLATSSRLGRDGLTRAWVGAGLPNRASQRAFASAGFQPVLGVFHVALGRLAWTRWHGALGASPALVGAARALLDGRCDGGD